MPDQSSAELGLSEEQLTGQPAAENAAQSSTTRLADRLLSPTDPPENPDSPITTPTPLADSEDTKVDVSAPDPGVSPETPPKKSPEKPTFPQERRLAQGLLDARTEQLKADKASGKTPYKSMSAGDQAIYSAYAFRGGLKEGTGTTIDKQPDGTVQGVTMQIDGQEYTVFSISAGRSENGKRVYTAKAKDSAGQDVDLPNISGDALADAHTAKHAKEIAESFPEGPHRDLVAWHAKGGTDELPKEAAEAVAKENDPILKRNRIIAENATKLRLEINGLKSRQEEIPAEKTLLLAQLDLALELKNSQISNLASLGVLRNLEASGVSEVTEIITEVKLEAIKEADAITSELAKAGLDETEIKLLKTEGFTAIAGNADLIARIAGMENIAQILGPDTSEEKIAGMLEATLTQTQKDWLKENKGKIKGGLLTALIMVLVLPVAAAVSVGAVGLGLANAGKGR